MRFPSIRNTWVLIFVIIEICVIVGLLIYFVVWRWVEVQAQVAKAEGGPCGFPEYACKLAEVVGFPKSWLQADTFIWWGILPMIGMSLIIFGFLNEIKIFKSTPLNFAIAVVIALSTIPIGWYVIFVIVMFQSMGQFSIVLFVIMFFTGLVLYFTRWTLSSVGEAMEQLDRIYDQYFKQLDENEKKTKRDIDALNRLIDDHTKRLKHLQEIGAPKTQINKVWQDIVAIEQEVVQKQAEFQGITLERKGLEKEKKAKRDALKREFEFAGKGKLQ